MPAEVPPQFALAWTLCELLVFPVLFAILSYGLLQSLLSKWRLSR